MIVLISDLFETFDHIPLEHKKRVAFIPNAKDNYDDKSGLEKYRAFFIQKGFTVEDVDLNQFKREQLYQKLLQFDIVYAAGGNTFVLMEKMLSSGFVDVIHKLLDQGIVYIGQSAGACVGGSSIEPITLLDDPADAHLQHYDGLHFVDFVFIPHAGTDRWKEAIAEVEKKYGKNFPLKKFTDSEGVIIDGNSLTPISSLPHH